MAKNLGTCELISYFALPTHAAFALSIKLQCFGFYLFFTPLILSSIPLEGSERASEPPTQC